MPQLVPVNMVALIILSHSKNIQIIYDFIFDLYVILIYVLISFRSHTGIMSDKELEFHVLHDQSIEVNKKKGGGKTI